MLFDQLAISIALAASINGGPTSEISQITSPVVSNNITALISQTTKQTSTQSSKKSYKKAANQRWQTRLSAINREEYFAQKLVQLPLLLRPGTDHKKESRPTIESARRCRSIIYQTYVKLPFEHTQNLKELTLYYTQDGRRGLGGSNVAVIRCLNVKKAELASVFVHEIGHVVDSGYLTGTNDRGISNFTDFGVPVTNDDPSSEYFGISWLNEKLRKPDATTNDFVSTYAMSDPFEDFAETYMFYRLHGSSFRLLAQKNQALLEKYNFMRHRVFGGQEFGSENVITYSDTTRRTYDATVIPFNLESFFNETQRY